MTGPRVEITYCTRCKFLLRAAWLAQELLTTFESELAEVALRPGSGGVFEVRMDGEVIASNANGGGGPGAGRRPGAGGGRLPPPPRPRPRQDPRRRRPRGGGGAPLRRSRGPVPPPPALPLR